jgi:uncharacterized protein
MDEAPISATPILAHDAPQPLARSARTTALIEGTIKFFVLGGVAIAADWFWLAHKPDWPLAQGRTALIVVLLLAFRAFVYPFLWFAAWRWQLRRADLITRQGWLWRSERAVPLDRIQHVDVDSGPIDRTFGIASVTVYTAGSGHANLAIPGLTSADAERLRDALLGRRRDDPEPSA